MKITTELFDSLERHNKIELPPAEKRLVRHSLQAIVRSLDVLKEIAVSRTDARIPPEQSAGEAAGRMRRPQTSDGTRRTAYPPSCRERGRTHEALGAFDSRIAGAAAQPKNLSYEVTEALIGQHLRK